MQNAPHNKLKTAAAQRQQIRGLHLTFASTTVVELVGRMALDFVYFDGEHGCFDWRDLETACLAAERHGLVAIARVPDPTAATITRFLDRGVVGLVVPHVQSVEEAQSVIEAAYFAPRGRRSFGAGRPGYGVAIGNKPEHLETENASTCVSIMIETRRGLEAAHDIAALDGIDYLSFGVNDLAQDLGYAGQPEHPDVVKAVNACADRIRKVGKPLREDFMKFAWINDVIVTGARQLLDAEHISSY
ncbi:HpcH/HpaI aldolase/citrate lyase family protein [Hydrogenophaga sp.]|uniref:HpcH/HpaI aldolase family protein n=1 Tax=Hydrogenophaga sp. TaxID=1904254 RepID=UPI00271A09CE|nr:aldolase/citrate lyase family protein [Hydrogenophaga sp.]MDO9436680.1 aldolase/citrate lyase family protein [Hydrogenophaga sp.]